MKRRQYRIQGLVQGVGFRPFVYRLATELQLSGFVRNDGQGVHVEVQGAPQHLNAFALGLKELPANAQIHALSVQELPCVDEGGFRIQLSSCGHGSGIVLPPDLAPCPDCLWELFDSSNRRYGYPFINCTACGPRFSIIEGLPYDRTQTTMRDFTMCAACQREYDDPADRRFHAQPNACPDCGPELFFGDSQGHQALLDAADAIRSGRIVAVKGVGGFQLMVDASNGDAVQELRRRKRRPDKPFALMYPCIDTVEKDCQLDSLERELLLCPEAPIVLLRAKRHWPGVAPGNPNLGVMLPSSPLHHLLLAELGAAVVATSGNRSGEPICHSNEEALEDLAGITDQFLLHNRAIHSFVDDSVVQVVSGRSQVLRRARGYASLPIPLKESLPATVAVGAHLKNTVAVAKGSKAYLSQHIGDLSTEKSYEAMVEQLRRLKGLYGVDPEFIVADRHPDYLSTQHATEQGKPIIHCPHHLAHVFSCMAEHELEPPLLGLAWDGTGLGDDGSIWGGECFEIREDGETRVAFLRPFPLPGVERAIEEPRLTASSLLYTVYGPQAVADQPQLLQLLQSGFRAPLCSSVGRLFDGVASLIGLRDRVTFEGQAAMELEFLAEKSETTKSYPFTLHEDGMLDWEPMIRECVSASGCKADKARAFHNSLVEMVVAVAERCGLKHVVLSGGVFQNRLLSESVIAALRRQGFTPHWHQKVPPNDGGIALGQLYYAGRQARLCV